MDYTIKSSDIGLITETAQWLVNPSEVNNNSGPNTTNKTAHINSDNYNDIILPTSIVVLIFAILAILINLLLLLASKFTTAGRDSILVFIRSLCVADTLIGIYGVSKFAFVSHRPQWVNCFLPDALLICAFIAGNFTLIGLLADCCSHIMHYLHKQGKQHYSKYKAIFLMIYLWNGAFILAFLPQMGWNHIPYTCAFFQYHSVYYLTFISILFFISILLMSVYSIKGSRLLRKLQNEKNNPPHVKIALVKIQASVRTSRVDVVAQVVSFLPLVIYMLLHCHSCVNADADYADAYLLVLVPIILLKSIIAGIIRGKRTSQISQVICKHWTLVYSTFKKSTKESTSRDVFHIETSEPEVDLSTEQTSTSDKESYYPKSMYKYALKRQLPHVYSRSISDDLSGYHRRRAQSVAMEAGLLNVTSLATAAPIPHIKESYVCSHCGYFNPINAASNKSTVATPHIKTGLSMSHPLQVLYAGKQWKNAAKKRIAVNSTSSYHKYAYDNETFKTSDDEKSEKHNDETFQIDDEQKISEYKLKHSRRRYSVFATSELSGGPFPISENKNVSNSLSKQMPFSSKNSIVKSRSNSLDTSISNSQIKGTHKDSILYKSSKLPQLQKVVKFKASPEDYDNVLEASSSNQPPIPVITGKSNGIITKKQGSISQPAEHIHRNNQTEHQLGGSDDRGNQIQSILKHRGEVNYLLSLEKGTDETRVCHFYGTRKGCWRGDACPYEHLEYKGGITTDRKLVYCSHDTENGLRPPEKGSWVAIEVTAIFNPSHFYITFPFGVKHVKDIIRDERSSIGDEGYEGSQTNISESLEALGEAMNETYDRLVYRDTDLTVFAPGEILAAQYSEDQQWYRARVIQPEPDLQKVQVFFVDFGNTEWIDESKTRQMQPQFMHLPFQAMECFLPINSTDEDGKWSQESKKLFREHVDGKCLIAHVLSRGYNILCVDLYDTDIEPDLNISQLLVDTKYAVRTEDSTSSRSYTTESVVSRTRSSSSLSINDRGVFVPG